MPASYQGLAFAPIVEAPVLVEGGIALGKIILENNSWIARILPLGLLKKVGPRTQRKTKVKNDNWRKNVIKVSTVLDLIDRDLSDLIEGFPQIGHQGQADLLGRMVARFLATPARVEKLKIDVIENRLRQDRKEQYHSVAYQFRSRKKKKIEGVEVAPVGITRSLNLMRGTIESQSRENRRLYEELLACKAQHGG